MKNKLRIIKIGGNIIDDEKKRDSFLTNFAQLKGFKILVHGGGKLATKTSERLGIKTQMTDGRRITSKENLAVVTMVYAGLINKTICAKLQGFNCNAIGLSGADANCILATKRHVKPIDFGWVGDIERVNTKAIELFLGNKITPVFCAITHDKKGQLLNTNADTIAAEIAISLSSTYETELIYCFEKKGVLADIKDDNSVIRTIDKKKYEELKTKKVIHEGMLPKMKNCFRALDKKVSKVIIGNTEVIGTQAELFTTIKL